MCVLDDCMQPYDSHNTVYCIPVGRIVDADCGNGLFCFERNGLERVPGCTGQGQNQFDYCYNPGNGFKRLAFLGDIEYDYYELQQCQGGMYCGLIFFVLLSRKERFVCQ